MRAWNDITRVVKKQLWERLGQEAQNKTNSKCMIGIGEHEACSEFCLLILDEV